MGDVEMRVFFKDFSKDMQEQIRGILNGNGLKVKDCILYKDGGKVVAEVRRSGSRYTIIW
jgi:hypothetical protein